MMSMGSYSADHLKCFVCCKRFSRRSNLNYHIKAMHSPGGVPASCACHVCGKDFGRPYALTIHMRIHTGSKPYKCDYCGREFSQAGNLKAHRRIHTGEKPYKCDLCTAKFRRNDSLQQHKATHYIEMPYKCRQCLQGFSSQLSASRHTCSMVVKKSPKPAGVPKPVEYIDPTADYSMSNEFDDSVDFPKSDDDDDDEINVDIDVEEDDNNDDDDDDTIDTDAATSYSTTSTSVPQRQNQPQHRPNQPQSRELIHTCFRCSKRFRWLTNLQKHQQNCRGMRHLAKPKPKVVSVNRNIFTTGNESLFKDRGDRENVQQRSTDKSQKHICKFCGRGFEEEESLRKHVEPGEEDTSFECEFCSKIFSYARNLFRHLRKHSGDFPYVCNLCEQKFKDSDSLHAHLSSHKRSYTYAYDSPHKRALQQPKESSVGIINKQGLNECRFCGKCFTTSAGLYGHSRIHQGDKPFKCEICFKTFSCLRYIQRHRKLHKGFTSSHTNYDDDVSHEEKRNAHQCPICLKTFSVRSYLVRHQAIHNAVKQFQCDICQARFTRLDNMKSHKRKHFHDGY